MFIQRYWISPNVKQANLAHSWHEIDKWVTENYTSILKACATIVYFEIAIIQATDWLMVDAGSPDSGFLFSLMQTLTYATHKLVNSHNTKIWATRLRLNWTELNFLNTNNFQSELNKTIWIWRQFWYQTEHQIKARRLVPLPRWSAHRGRGLHNNFSKFSAPQIFFVDVACFVRSFHHWNVSTKNYKCQT